MLTQIGVRFEVLRFSIDETPFAGEGPKQYVARMSIEKAKEGFRIADGLAPVTLPVLAADTIVVADGEILGKPDSEQQGLAMLRLLSGSIHRVITAVTMLTEAGIETVSSDTEVAFRVLRESEINAYWASGEPADKAGGYAIQGLGSIFVSHIKGSYSGVVGLPLNETAGLLESVGIRCL